MTKKLIIYFMLSNILVFAFSCSGGGTGVSIKVTPTSHTYGTVAVPNYETADFVIKNSSKEIFTITSMRFSGATPTEFFISAGASVPKNIYSRGEVIITIRFQPRTKGPKSALLEILHTKPNMNPLTINVKGNATTFPQIEADPLSHNFGSMWVQGIVDHEFTIRSTGTEALNISALTMGGINGSEFKIVNPPTVPLMMDPGNVEKFTIEWTSTNPPGVKNAALTIQHNAVGFSTVINLTADATPYMQLEITTTRLSNGTSWETYIDDLESTGGNGNEIWSVKSGDFPAGLAINPLSGEITGKPAYPGAYDFTIEIDDGISSDEQQYLIDVVGSATWEDVTPSGFLVKGRSAVGSHEFRLFFFGGTSNGNGVTDIKIFDTLNDTFQSASSSLPQARERACTATIGNYIYIFGGRSSSFSTGMTIGSVAKYNATTNSITSDAYMPNGGQYNMTCGIHDGKVYILGGAAPYDKKVYEFTPGSGGGNGSWTTKGDLLLGAGAMGFASYNMKMYLFGGYFFGLMNEVREYDVTTGEAGTPVGNTIQRTGRMQYGLIVDSAYMVDNVDNLQKFNFTTFAGNSANYPDCPMTTTYSYSSQNVECMGRIYINKGYEDSNQIYAYTP
ncbi:MAG: choice-of-anchor D domain-containing protein [Planctomycetes bacterium]|nr:choice-of-anchor D domain-containing protein [Planctomycetota bacterium]